MSAYDDRVDALAAELLLPVAPLSVGADERWHALLGELVALVAGVVLEAEQETSGNYKRANRAIAARNRLRVVAGGRP